MVLIAEANEDLPRLPEGLSRHEGRRRQIPGPSLPGHPASRMAPVTTTDWGPSHVWSRKKAVSSSVSVPCVTTTASDSEAARARSRLLRSRNVRLALALAAT
jgi:hypothetical protein